MNDSQSHLTPAVVAKLPERGLLSQKMKTMKGVQERLAENL